jgi:hypothetical protein
MAMETLSVQVPTLDEIAKMYKEAVSTKDDRLKTLAESALSRLAVAEAAVSEAATVLAFNSRIKG